MTYKVPVDKEHMQWFMDRVEERCKDKDTANLLRIHGRFDLEIVVVVAPQDRPAITHEFLVDMKRAMRDRTQILAPVIYLDDEEPRTVRAYDPHL